MKKIILMIFIILILFFTAHVRVLAATAGGSRSGGQESEREGSMNKIVKIVSPAIVKVVVDSYRKRVATGLALDDSHVISNREVLRSHYNRIYVQTVDGKAFRAKLVGQDRGSSIILLSIGKKILKPIKWAKSSEVGDWVALVGAFYREFPAIQKGFISSLSDEEMLLNAPVVPGMSGCPVVNKKGELVGIMRGRASFAKGPDYTWVSPEAEVVIRSSRSNHKELAVALPVEKVFSISNDLKKFGKVRRGWLGVNLITMDTGVVISSVVPNSPASSAGLRKGDVLLKIHSNSIRNTRDVSTIVRKLKPSEKVKINILRGKLNKSVMAVMGDLEKRHFRVRVSPGDIYDVRAVPEIGEVIPRVENFVFRIVGARNLGVQAIAIGPELAKEFKIKEGAGLMISKVLKNTAAEKAGLRTADVIVRVGGTDIAKNTDLRNALNELEDEEPVKVVVYRKGKQRVIDIVPDKSGKFNAIFDRFTNTIKDIRIHMDDQNKMRLEAIEAQRERRRSPKALKFKEKRGGGVQTVSVKEKETAEKKELEKYKSKVEKMEREQEQMRKDMLKLKKMLEKKEKEKVKDKKKEKDKKDNND
ncbi:MAG: PDZ domain-containing protein [bacterium]|nr:PDZ domain-containing protein [bacterium]